ncbi:chemotaxis protein [Aeromonas molluscorum]|uniref:Two-component system chemotaxis response regulator CheV n=1 Tax=Aeromonas molluscorum 848 TaxID=1268236 RepID=R1GWD2_9GAMM|nr:chemotaxis protein [Aeromonas molluscorum]EOD55885.1 two-component system chemotaxis response regulator CheV [Aeromonas molluscorum 848]
MKSKANQSQGMLLFHLAARQSFAIGTLKVKEIVPYTRLTALPHSHPTVLGAANMRGTTIPVIDMAMAVGYRRISEEEMANCFIIITDCRRTLVGFLVRGIDKITECNWRDIESPPPALGSNVFVTGVTRVNDQLIQLLDVELILSRVYPDDPSHLYPVLTDVQRERIKPMRILLVDDSSVARKQLTAALDYINIPYDVCTNGKDALVLMQDKASKGMPIDILVSDIEMPGLDGYELAFEAQSDAQLAGAYIILHTSLSSEISVERAHQVGAHEALTKFEANELIQAMLRGAEHHDSLVS